MQKYVSGGYYRAIIGAHGYHRTAHQSFQWLSAFSTSSALPKEPDFEAARKWYSELFNSPLPHTIGEITYSRSSGPGGQNVNKVNSKAQLRVTLEELLPHLPQVLHDGIRSSPYFAGKSSSLLFQADTSRKQAANKEACYQKLNDVILEVYKKAVPGETSEKQKQHVKNLKKAENESRLRLKKRMSSKKAARRGPDD